MVAHVCPINRALVDSARDYLASLARGEQPQADTVADWNRFYGLCDQSIRSFVAKQGLRGNDLDDCTQNVWIRLIKQLPGFEYDPSRSAFRTWLYTVARSAAMDHLRRQVRRRAAFLGSPSAAEPVDTGCDPRMQVERAESTVEADRLLAAARQHVSKDNYRLMCMRWLDGRPVAEVAEELGISSKQVWYREHRLRKKLREVLGPEFQQ